MVSSDVLAENICTNPARVRKVLAKLKNAGLLLTKEGRIGGGYALAPNAEKTTLCTVLDALGGTVVNATWHSGDSDLPCLIASGMAGVMDGIYAGMNTASRDYLDTITIKQIENQIFA